jgi:hypothetical protein
MHVDSTPLPQLKATSMPRRKTTETTNKRPPAHKPTLLCVSSDKVTVTEGNEERAKTESLRHNGPSLSLSGIHQKRKILQFKGG